MGLRDDREPGLEPADGAQLIGRQTRKVVLDALRVGAGEPTQRSRQPVGVHHPDDLAQRRRPLRVGALEDLQHVLDVPLRRALVKDDCSIPRCLLELLFVRVCGNNYIPRQISLRNSC